MKQQFILAHPIARERALTAVKLAPDGYMVEVKERTRSLQQSAMFHAICNEIAVHCDFAGKKRTPEQWKVLLVSGHAIATKMGSEMAPGLEGEWVNLRESTAKMSAQRISSLIEYSRAWATQNGIELYGEINHA